ncbi:PilN domain-containing protein [Enhygromyxa salina]|uniref:Fimbrial assembly protein (PilN) n=1 Tax=Enhygromyxa salina TaxID=215803 RepID=A0A2S9YI80_9BACT|nr:PilN domain-containing protein [Enhygromyxa salina]PRQ04789.1 Fimbrial assembly protein (PilN) [Enhygromyxa salina]
MIRINLSPTVKRKPQSTRAITAVQMVVPSTNVSKGSIYAVLMLVGWVGVGVGAWVLQSGVVEDTERLKAKASVLVEDTRAINEKIDEEDLQARFNRYEELTAAAEALQQKRRTPVYVYHELTNVLTTGRMPDIDEAEQRKRVALDPQARLALDWDANAVWLTSMQQDGDNLLQITGSARDPDDLSEFVKRLRASARFARVSHPEFALEEVTPPTTSGAPKPLRPGEALHNHYTFELNAQVRYWD